MSTTDHDSAENAPEAPEAPREGEASQSPAETPGGTQIDPGRAQGEPQGSEGGADGADGADSGGGNREARYRVRAREAEAERDTLREQVSTIQRRFIADIATTAGGLKSAEVLWLSGAELSSLLTEDGAVDRQAVLAACDAAADQLGLSRARTPKPNPAQGRSEAVPSSGPADWFAGH